MTSPTIAAGSGCERDQTYSPQNTAATISMTTAAPRSTGITWL